MKAKICGITSVEDAQLALNAQADLLGIILTGKSKRSLSVDIARKILESLGPHSKRVVGVFLDEPIQHIAHIAKELKLEWVQLQAPSLEEELGAIKHLHKILVIPIDSTGAYKSTGYENPEGFWLYDASQPGSGKKFNWEKFRQLETGPFFIAGGLSPENVLDAFERFHPDGVDVSSGVCSVDGIKKDTLKVKEFIKRAHEAQSS
ncbi:MAG: N-(5'-phosphoribosyl)anthranilate isomerase [Chlamydiae bacterium]|nr:N-(5'-phosphoribosyl)anthranilate isomerase [Chlamydiota bacterium]